MPHYASWQPIYQSRYHGVFAGEIPEHLNVAEATLATVWVKSPTVTEKLQRIAPPLDYSPQPSPIVAGARAGKCNLPLSDLPFALERSRAPFGMVTTTRPCRKTNPCPHKQESVSTRSLQLRNQYQTARSSVVITMTAVSPAGLKVCNLSKPHSKLQPGNRQPTTITQRCVKFPIVFTLL